MRSENDSILTRVCNLHGIFLEWQRQSSLLDWCSYFFVCL